MIDLKALRTDPEPYRRSVKLRRFDESIIDRVLKLDADYRDLLPKVEALRGELKLKGKPSEAELIELQNKKAKLEVEQEKLRQLEGELDTAARLIPNLLAEGTPEGGEDDFKVERSWGEPREGEGLQDHLEITSRLDLVDFERGAKVAGAKFYYTKGALVRLEMAVMRLAMDRLEAAGFTLMSVPHMVTNRIAEGAGFMPRGEEPQIYHVDSEDLNLIATAEMPLVGYHADEILPNQNHQYAALSPSYRLEAGSYGKHAKGLFRVHQFDKLEMFIYCPPKESAEWLTKLVAIEEDLLRALELPYRVIRLATGDMGAPHFEKYDLEYWSPVDASYREIASASNCTDYQARRLNIRMRDEAGASIVPHTLNNTAIAFSRVSIALLENHQQGDGTIRMPEALIPYYGGPTL